MGKNIERLGRVIARRATKTATDLQGKVPGKVELGTIDSNLALVPDSIRLPIPKGDYMLTLTLTGDFLTEDETPTCSEGGTCTHHHRLPENEFRTIQPGDRVLIAWCGNEAVVVSIVVSS